MDDALLQQARALPKIELHRHLEGSLRINTLLSIGMEHRLTLPSTTEEGLRPFVQLMPGEPRNWQQFLGKFAVLRQFYRSKSIIQRVTHEVIADAAADNVRYLELRFTPQALNNLMKCAFDDIVDWVCAAAAEAAAAHDIQCALILSMNRHEAVEVAESVIETAIAFKDRGIVGIDLAGQESGFSSQPFARLFERAKAAGLFITVHAGEWSGAENIREAVESLGANRIGHGVRAGEDPAVVQMLIERGIPLEVCPTSNVDSGVIGTYAEHPITALYQAGVRTTLNTDDPLISNITLSDEYAAAMRLLKFSIGDIRRHILTAADSAFLPAEGRTALVARFRSWLDGDQGGKLQ
ncbi:MAG: adenosine deaminase [Anaerolineae bacterium]|nr:adenosine deaminase [Anaerolineae bacterium]NUQ04453.1 adenosine deaminase [Anaerolineae bacterium]